MGGVGVGVGVRAGVRAGAGARVGARGPRLLLAQQRDPVGLQLQCQLAQRHVGRLARLLGLGLGLGLG